MLENEFLPDNIHTNTYISRFNIQIFVYANVGWGLYDQQEEKAEIHQRLLMNQLVGDYYWLSEQVPIKHTTDMGPQ